MTDDDGTAASAGAALGWELSTAVVLFHEAIAQRLGLSAADHKALAMIMREGPTSATELAQRTGLTPGAVTGLVDRLESAGYVQRAPDPADRRRSVISGRYDPRSELAEVFTELTREMGAFMSKYDEQQRAAIADYVTNTIEVLHAQTRRLST